MGHRRACFVDDAKRKDRAFIEWVHNLSLDAHLELIKASAARQSLEDFREFSIHVEQLARDLGDERSRLCLERLSTQITQQTLNMMQLL
jgi:hypothetical protein